MNKAVFLNELGLYLQKMNGKEKSKFITYYDEMISDYVENGMSEEDAVKKIGAPKKIAEELLENYDTIKFNLSFTSNKNLNKALLVLGFPLWGCILLTIILSVLSFYMIIWGIPFTTGASCLGLFAASVYGIIGTPFMLADNLSMGTIQFGVSIASIGFALLLGIITVVLSKRFVVTTKNLNVKLTALFKKKVVIR